MERVESHASFGGRQEVWQHESSTLNCTMRVGVYLPPQALAGETCPVFLWLSGLTCTEQNFITKANAQQVAAELGWIVIAPDTSPRGDDVADDEGYDLGKGAGFYVNATQAPWSSHYRMDDYINVELRELVSTNFPVNGHWAISGHSMGGHGALTSALRNPGLYASASAFSPIVAPSVVPWGIKAFTAYLGEDTSTWSAYDTVELINNGAGNNLPMRIDQGGDDEFLHTQLQTERLAEAVAARGLTAEINVRPGHDHSYYFVSSFLSDHLRWHAAWRRNN